MLRVSFGTGKKQKWKQAKRKGCINWHKKMEQNKESWALRQKKVVRLSEHGIQNKTNDQFLFEAGICFIFHIERERNLPLRSNLEFDPFWLLHLTIRSTMGTFVIFKLSPPLNDHLLLDNGNQSRLKMGGVHLALMKWMFSDAAWDTAGNGPVLYFSKLPLSRCV